MRGLLRLAATSPPEKRLTTSMPSPKYSCLRSFIPSGKARVLIQAEIVSSSFRNRPWNIFKLRLHVQLI